MATFTLTVDDQNGFDTALFFVGNQAVDFSSSAIHPSTGEADCAYQLYVDGVLDSSKLYIQNLAGKGSSFSSTNIDGGIEGTITSMSLSAQTGSDPAIQLAHLDIVLGSNTGLLGGVDIATSFLTPEQLMSEPARIDNDGASLKILGNLGNDTLRGSGFSDIIFGREGRDVCLGGAAGDILEGGTGADRLDGGTGLDTASYANSSSGVAVNLVTGKGSGGDAAGDRLIAIECVTGSKFADSINGNAAFNYLVGGAGFDVIRGGAGDDSIFGQDGGGRLYGGDGDDRLDGGAQKDTIWGGAGNEDIRVGDGDNVAYGEAGDDFLLGGDGNDEIQANFDLSRVEGSNILDGGRGMDTMYGGTGADTFYVDNAKDVVRNFVGGVGDRVFASVSYVLLGGNPIDQLATTNAAGKQSINLSGNEFSQIITGNAGENTLRGLDGADTLLGRIGDDRLNGGLGKDTMTGGNGADTFAYAAVIDSTPGPDTRDVITDFTHGTDKIELLAIDAKLHAPDNNVFTFIGSAAFSAEGQIRVASSGGNTLVMINVDGTANAEMVIQLDGIDPSVLNKDDFIL